MSEENDPPAQGMPTNDDPLPLEIEVAWMEWSRQLQHVDPRTLAALRAAFAAGYLRHKARRR